MITEGWLNIMVIGRSASTDVLRFTPLVYVLEVCLARLCTGFFRER